MSESCCHFFQKWEWKYETYGREDMEEKRSYIIPVSDCVVWTWKWPGECRRKHIGSVIVDGIAVSEGGRDDARVWDIEKEEVGWRREETRS